MSADVYTPPKVWRYEKENGGAFASINRPTSGPTHQKVLPRGRHPIQLCSQGTWNGMKVTIMLEELLEAGFPHADYDAWLVDIMKGDQFGSGFVELNPNSKIPALVDYGTERPVRIFESGAILLYLAEKFRHFLPTDAAARMDCLSWLFWQVGSTRYVGGGFAHLYKYAPIKIEYAIDRYTMELKRQLHVLDRQLADRPYILGSEYTIADIACFPWYGTYVLGWYNDIREFIDAQEYDNVRRWAEDIREASCRAARTSRQQDAIRRARHAY